MYYDRKPGENCQGLQRPVLEKNNPPYCEEPLNKSGHTAGGAAKSRPQDCNRIPGLCPGGGSGGAIALPKTTSPCSHFRKPPTGNGAQSRPQDCNRIPGLCPGGGSFSALRKTFLTNLPSGSEATRQICAARRQRASNSRKWPQPLSGSVSSYPDRPRGQRGRSAAPVPCPPAQSGPSPVRSPGRRPSAQRWRSAQSAAPSRRNHESSG